jgi:putative hydrolase of the HAD superfamily
MIQALIFDLDDTLYPEKDFLRSGYRAVARYVADSSVCSFDHVFSTMMTALNTLGRQKVFPTLLIRFPSISIPLVKLVEIYRQHTPNIDLFPGYLSLLRDLACRYRLGMITDGLPAVQERKVRALGLEGILEKIIYSWEYGSERGKPHPLSFSLMLESFQADPQSALFVGDNIEKDGRGAHGVGMKYAQIQHRPLPAVSSGEAGRGMPEFVIHSLFQLPQILQQMSGNEN